MKPQFATFVKCRYDAAQVILPVLLILCAACCAAAVAYGTHPAIAQYHHGVEAILLARRLEWPLASLSILSCMALIGLVVAGRTRAWFLITLGPLVALFAHHFAPPHPLPTVEDQPRFIPAEEASFLRGQDFVIGINIADQSFAYPFAELFSRPVILQAEHDQRLILIWSAYANRAIAYRVAHELHGRDLEVVSTPGNALLVYNTQRGQPINGVTGLTDKGTKPSGFESMLPAVKTTWTEWKRQQPLTLVLAPPAGGIDDAAPRQPIAPAFPMPPTAAAQPADLRVALVGALHPVAIDSASVDQHPLNLDVDGAPVLIFRQTPEQPLQAFDRRLPGDLRPRFDLLTGRSRADGFMVDADTNSIWNAKGEWVRGYQALKGKKLAPIPIEDGLYWGVMKFWLPDLALQRGMTPAFR